MTCPELITAMAADGYWSSPAGRTPSATLYSALLREVTTKGPQSRFRKAGRGQFALLPRRSDPAPGARPEAATRGLVKGRGAHPPARRDVRRRRRPGADGWGRPSPRGRSAGGGPAPVRRRPAGRPSAAGAARPSNRRCCASPTSRRSAAAATRGSGRGPCRVRGAEQHRLLKVGRERDSRFITWLTRARTTWPRRARLRVVLHHSRLQQPLETQRQGHQPRHPRHTTPGRRPDAAAPGRPAAPCAPAACGGNAPHARSSRSSSCAAFLAPRSASSSASA